MKVEHITKTSRNNVGFCGCSDILKSGGGRLSFTDFWRRLFNTNSKESEDVRKR